MSKEKEHHRLLRKSTGGITPTGGTRVKSPQGVCPLESMGWNERTDKMNRLIVGCPHRRTPQRGDEG